MLARSDSGSHGGSRTAAYAGGWTANGGTLNSFASIIVSDRAA